MWVRVRACGLKEGGVKRRGTGNRPSLGDSNITLEGWFVAHRVLPLPKENISTMRYYPHLFLVIYFISVGRQKNGIALFSQRGPGEGKFFVGGTTFSQYVFLN